MAGITEAYAVTETVGTTEWSFVTDTAGPDASTDEGEFQGYFDVNAFAAGDEFTFKVYEKIASGGTQRLVDSFTLAGAQSNKIYKTGVYMLKHGWDMTWTKAAGTDRSIIGSIREVADPSVSVTTVPNTIGVDAGGTLTIGATGATVVNTGTVSVGDKTSFALSAAGVTAVQSGLALSSQVDTLEGFFAGGTFSRDAGGTLTLGASGVTIVPASLALNASFPANFSTTFPEVYQRLHLDAANPVTETKAVTTFAGGVTLTRVITNEGLSTQQVVTTRTG